MKLEIDLPDDWTAIADPSALRTQVDAAMVTLGQARLRLTTLIDIPAQVAEIGAAYLNARDGIPPDIGQASDWPAYRQPTGAHDAYPAGRVIRWTDDRLYRAVRSGVVHTPAEYPPDWSDVTEALVGTAPPDPAPSAPAWLATATYRVGDLVSKGGQIYRCLIAHGAEQQGTWPPGAAWTVWGLV